MIFCLKIEEFLLFLTCCFKFTTNHESKFASTCRMCFPNQFPVKIHIFLFFNFVPLHGIAHDCMKILHICRASDFPFQKKQFSVSKKVKFRFDSVSLLATVNSMKSQYIERKCCERTVKMAQLVR